MASAPIVSDAIDADVVTYVHRALGDVADVWRRHREEFAALIRTPKFRALMARVRADQALCGEVEEYVASPVSADEPRRAASSDSRLWHGLQRKAMEIERGHERAATVLQHPPGDWEAVLSAYPEWMTPELFNAFVYAAQSAREEENDPLRTHEIASFAVRYSDGLSGSTANDESLTGVQAVRCARESRPSERSR